MAALSSAMAPALIACTSSCTRCSATLASICWRDLITVSTLLHPAAASSSASLRRWRSTRTSRATSSVSSSSESFFDCSRLSCPLNSSNLASSPSVLAAACSSGMMTQAQYSQIKSETGMNGVTSMSDWRMVPECMHTALQSSNWPDPASKNISCDLWSRSIMCCVLRSESFFSCSNCWAMRNLASERARFTLETPSSIVMAKRCIVSMSSACSMMPPKALTCALKLNVASFLMSTLEMLPRVEVFRLMTCDGQRRSPSGSSGCVDSMKTSKASPTTTAYRSVHEAS
mmetsp:Transcript_11033/g.36624  ORF Transcript_11033/g.36624 Transcript_11033/m.36624 type:complete len:287 (+) Transcript_11033:864-1724(+)